MPDMLRELAALLGGEWPETVEMEIWRVEAGEDPVWMLDSLESVLVDLVGGVAL